MKQIKDYLHLYLGCDCVIQGEENVKKITGISYDDTQRIWWAYFENEENGYAMIDDVAPILRKLEDMTDEERSNAIEPMTYRLKSLRGKELHLQAAELTNYLLSKRFDLFGLIDERLAVNAAEFKTVV